MSPTVRRGMAVRANRLGLDMVSSEKPTLPTTPVNKKATWGELFYSSKRDTNNNKRCGMTRGARFGMVALPLPSKERSTNPSLLYCTSTCWPVLLGTCLLDTEIKRGELL